MIRNGFAVKEGRWESQERGPLGRGNETRVKILFITSNRIGDAVLSTGVLGHLLEAHPEACITIACGPAPAPLFRAVPNLDRIIEMKKGRRAAHWRHLWSRTAPTVWDLVVDLRASAFAWTVLTRRRLVFRPRRAPVHRVSQLGGLIGRGENPPAPRLWLDDAARAEAEKRIPLGAPVLAVGPTANWAGKQWPAENFVEVIERLTNNGGILPGARVAVFGSAAEREVALPVLQTIPAERRIDLAEGTELPVAAACLQRCALFVGNDSGLMHAAAAVGVPTLGLFGPSKEVHYAPWGEHGAWVRSDRSFEDYVGAPGYDYTTTESLMDDLTVDRVTKAAEALWKRTSA